MKKTDIPSEPVLDLQRLPERMTSMSKESVLTASIVLCTDNPTERGLSPSSLHTLSRMKRKRWRSWCGISSGSPSSIFPFQIFRGDIRVGVSSRLQAEKQRNIFHIRGYAEAFFKNTISSCLNGKFGFNGFGRRNRLVLF
jgi:hypothetical protein